MVLTMLAGGVPLLWAILLLARRSAGLPFDLSDPAAISADLSPARQQAILALLLVGVGVKVPLIGLHTWLVGMLMEGPLAAAIWLIGLKTAGYALLRLLPLVAGAPQLGQVLATVGALGVLIGAMLALVQTNLRRIVAFLAISHASLLPVAAAARHPEALHAALGLTLDAGLSLAALALAVGLIRERAGTTDLASVGGLARSPRLALALLGASLAVVGFPGFFGFPLELMLVRGVMQRLPIHALLIGVGLALGGAAVARMLVRALTGEPREEIPDLSARECAVIGALLAGSAAGGLWPGLWLG